MSHMWPGSPWAGNKHIIIFLCNWANERCCHWAMALKQMVTERWYLEVNLLLTLSWFSLFYSIAPNGREAGIFSTNPIDCLHLSVLTHTYTQKNKTTTNTFFHQKWISLVSHQSTFSSKTPQWACSLRALLWGPNAQAIRLGLSM